MAFEGIFRREREEREMTSTKLARRVDISIAYLSRSARRRENPPPMGLDERHWQEMKCLRRRGGCPPGSDRANQRCDCRVPPPVGRSRAMTMEVTYPTSPPARIRVDDGAADYGASPDRYTRN